MSRISSFAVRLTEPDQDDREHVYRFALSLCRDRWLADDLAQEAILRAVRSEVKFASRIELRKWLFRVTRNLWIDRARKLKRRGAPLDLQDVAVADDGPHQRAELTEEMEAVFGEMQRLPDKQRQVLHLRVVEDMSVRDVAETLDMSLGAVKTNLSLARKRLRESHNKYQALGHREK